MSDIPRKKSPRAPSIALDAAIERVLRVYAKEGRHAAVLDTVAQNLGYKGANNGSFLGMIASLKYFGLIERPKDGYLAVSKDVESYKFAPSEGLRQEILNKWLKKPAIFNELLQQYSGSLPSDATLKYELIQRGFSAKAADDCVAVFRKSVEFTRYFDVSSFENDVEDEHGEETTDSNVEENVEERDGQSLPTGGDGSRAGANPGEPKGHGGMDRIPVRLAGGRRAWLEIPVPFYESDKKHLVAQIELILTDDEEYGDLI